MVYGTYNYSIHGVYKPTFTSLGGPTLYLRVLTKKMDFPGILRGHRWENDELMSVDGDIIEI